MFQVRFKEDAEKELRGIPKKFRDQIKERLIKLASDPWNCSGVKKLSGSEDEYRLRSGVYRILYTMNDDDQVIVIYRISHRKDAYKDKS